MPLTETTIRQHRTAPFRVDLVGHDPLCQVHLGSALDFFALAPSSRVSTSRSQYTPVGTYFNLGFAVGNREPTATLHTRSFCYIYVVPLTVPQAFCDVSPCILPYTTSVIPESCSLIQIDHISPPRTLSRDEVLHLPIVPSFATDRDVNIYAVTDDGISRRGCGALAGYQGFTENYHPSHSSITRDREMIIYIRAPPRDDTKAIYKPKFAYNR